MGTFERPHSQHPIVAFLELALSYFSPNYLPIRFSYFHIPYSRAALHSFSQTGIPTLLFSSVCAPQKLLGGGGQADWVLVPLSLALTPVVPESGTRFDQQRGRFFVARFPHLHFFPNCFGMTLFWFLGFFEA